jgi:1,2-phenylacetyl-CoA epoxidase catalytic subunit
MVQTHTVNANASAVFTQLLDVQNQDMRNLYEKAKRDQWNASTDIDWDKGGDLDCGILPDALIDIYETKYWDKLDDKKRLELNRHFSAWRISQLMYGEQFALMVCGQIANSVSDIDSKFFMATQVVDEARHSEVLARYLYQKVGVTYPLTANLKKMFDHVLEMPQWYLKTVGTQLVAETLAVSLFRMLADHSPDPLIGQICQRILSDESRHMGFGMLSLPDQMKELSEQELREAEDFACEATAGLLQGQFPKEAYEAVGFTKAEIEDIRTMRHKVAKNNDYVAFRTFFKKDFHAALWSNMGKVGLLSDRTIGKLSAMDISAPQPHEQAAA